MNIRFATPDDARACNEFHNRAYQTARTDEQWRWEFLVPAGASMPFVVAEEDGRILGTQALIPIRMVDEKGVYASAKSEETLLDPALRGRGALARMYRMLFEHAESLGILVIWGFTPATKAFEKVGFATPYHMSQLFLPLAGDALAKALAGVESSIDSGVPKRLRGTAVRAAGLAAATASRLVRVAAGLRPLAAPGREVRLETLRAPPPDAGDVCHRFVKQWSGTTIHRDADYLRWRFFQNPHVQATVRAAYLGDRLVGWVAYSLDDNCMGYVVDLMAAAEALSRPELESVCERLLGDVIASLVKMGAVGVRAWTLNEHPFDQTTSRVARRLGFFRYRHGGTVVTYLLPGAAKRPSVGQYDRWYVNRMWTDGSLG